MVRIVLAMLAASAASAPIHGHVEISIRARPDGTGDRGTFVVRGALSDSGRVVTRPLSRAATQATHELRTLVGRRGRIVLRLDGHANFFAVNVYWRIISATGAYTGLRGSGTGRDTILPGSRISGHLVGVVWRDAR